MRGVSLALRAGPDRLGDRPERRRQDDAAGRGDGPAAVARARCASRARTCTGSTSRRASSAACAWCRRSASCSASSRVLDNLQLGAYRASGSRGDALKQPAAVGLRPLSAPGRAARAARRHALGRRAADARARPRADVGAAPADARRAEPRPGAADRAEILTIVRKLRDDGVSILLVEQNARAALESSDHGYVLETGEIALRGASADAGRATRACRRPTSAAAPTMTSERRAPLPPRAAHAAGDAAAAGRAASATRPLLRDRAARAWSHARCGAAAAAARAGALRAAGVARGDRVALMCGNRDRVPRSLPRPAAGSAPSSVPINTASMGPQIDYFLAEQRRAAAGDRGRLRRAAGDGGPRRARRCATIWVVGEARRRCVAPRRRRRAARASPLPDAGDAAPIAPAAVQPGDRSPSSTPRAPPARPRASSARMRSTTGGACNSARRPRRRRRRRAVHHAAAVPHQRAQHLRAGRARRRRGGVRAALLGLGLLAGDARPRRDGRLPARRDGADPARAAGGRGRARPPRAHRPRPRRAGRGRRRRSAARTGVRLLEGYGSTETNFVIATRARLAARAA